MIVRSPFADDSTAIGALLIVTLAVAGLFIALPWLDPALSRLFFTGTEFPANTDAISQRIRFFIWDMSIAMFCGAALMWGIGFWRKGVWGIPHRIWGFILAVYLLGPILLVNRVLKEHWGRARPDTTTLFGGDWAYTPFWRPGQQCVDNCSFVSGEGASGAALAIALMTLAPYATRAWPGWSRALYVMTAGGLLGAAMGQRLVAGRHFASDVLFSVLFVALIAAILRPILLRPRR